MKYSGEIVEAIFRKRPNRFIAHVMLEGQEIVVHVKNTGRCRELLLEGSRVILEKGTNPTRKTAYSLIAVYKGDVLINMDSQVPNGVVLEALREKKLFASKEMQLIKPEKKYGQSRFDVYYEHTLGKGFIEVKGVTLEHDGVALFPDAPTERGTKHLKELLVAAKEGYEATVIFLIQMKAVKVFRPNVEMDPVFAEALFLAWQGGVNVLAFDAQVEAGSIYMGNPIEVLLQE